MANVSAVHTSLPALEAMGNAGLARTAGEIHQKNVVAHDEPREAANGEKPNLAGAARPLPGLREVHLQLHIDERTGDVFGRWVDRHTGDKVREIPSQQLRDLTAQINSLFDHLIDQSA